MIVPYGELGDYGYPRYGDGTRYGQAGVPFVIAQSTALVAAGKHVARGLDLASPLPLLDTPTADPVVILRFSQTVPPPVYEIDVDLMTETVTPLTVTIVETDPIPLRFFLRVGAIAENLTNRFVKLTLIRSGAFASPATGPYPVNCTIEDAVNGIARFDWATAPTGIGQYEATITITNSQNAIIHSAQFTISVEAV